MEPYDYFRDYLYSFLDEDVDAQKNNMPCSITDGIQQDHDEIPTPNELTEILEEIALCASIDELRFEPEIRRVDFMVKQAN